MNKKIDKKNQAKKKLKELKTLLDTPTVQKKEEHINIYFYLFIFLPALLLLLLASYL